MTNRINNENKIIKLFGEFAVFVSVLGFGMYFIHKLLLEAIRPVIKNLNLYRPVTAALFFVIIFAVSFTA